MEAGNRKIVLGVVATALLCLGLGFLLRSFLSAGEERRSTGIPLRASAPAGAVPAVKDLPPGAGTRRMAQRLSELAARSDFLTNIYANNQRLERFRAIVPPPEPQARLTHDTRLAYEMLNAGETAEAIQLLESVWERADAVPGWRTSPFGLEARSRLAVAHLRLGEQENCIRHHGTDSCLMPIRGGGVHKEQRGSRGAIKVLTDMLTRDPDDLRSVWMLNLAYMTLGEYPEKVPAKWLIPPSVFESDYDIGRFTDVAAQVGLDVMGWAGAAMMEDFDGDGYLDMMLTSWRPGDQMQFFRNDRNGRFSDRTDEAGLTGLVSGLNAVHADYDNDGDMDVFVPRGAWLFENGKLPPSLLRNDGRGRFEDVTEVAGLLAYYPSQAATWGDYDNDGWVDLFVAPETQPKGTQNHTRLYHNNADGTFTEVASQVGVSALAYFKGAVWGDYDNDGLLDLYVTTHDKETSNMLFHNEGKDAQGQWRFTEVAALAGVLEPSVSFPTWFFDYDNDGWLDIFVSGFSAGVEDIAADYVGKPHDAETPRLYHNQRDGTFRDVSREAGVSTAVLTMGCNFGDLDNDGWLDFYLGTGNPDYRTLVPNRMFRNAGGKFFQDVTTSGGFGHLQKGHGVAFGDLDNDGDQDVFIKIGGAYDGDPFQSALFENPGHGNHWITLRLVGVETNRAAIGARIKVTIDEPGGSRDVHVTVTSGSSFGGSSLQQEIGLGQAERVRRIEITWPTTGRSQVLEDVEVDQALEIREGDSAPQPITRDRLTLGRPANPA